MTFLTMSRSFDGDALACTRRYCAVVMDLEGRSSSSSREGGLGEILFGEEAGDACEGMEGDAGG